MTAWTSLTECTTPLSRGNLVRCSLDGESVVMVLSQRGGLGVTPIVGSKTGVRLREFPSEAHESAAISPAWLLEHWVGLFGSPVEDVAVRGDLDAREIAPVSHTPLADFTKPLERGWLLECANFGYPFEELVYMMVVEVDTRLGFMAITGYKAGIHPWWRPSVEASSDIRIDPRWLVDNAARWIPPDARLGDINVRAPLRIDEF